MANDQLKKLLGQWATLEPHRCRTRDDERFEVLYAGHWLVITDGPDGHGALITAALEGCHANRIYCKIEYTPAYEAQLPEVEVGCIYKAFRWDEGEEAVYSIPELLLTEYLERLQPAESATEV